MIVHAFLFLCWPFMYLIYSTFHYEKLSSKLVIIFFFGLYGFSFLNNNISHDSWRYAESFVEISKLDFNKFQQLFLSSNTDNGGKVDFFINILQYLISRFTSNPKVMFGFLGLIFGFFTVFSFDLLYERYKKSNNIYALIFLFFFLFIIPFFRIGAIRFWLASWVFFYGAYHVVCYKKYKYILLSAFSIFIHITFVSINIVLCLYVLLGDRDYFYYPILILSFIYPKSIIDNLDKFLPKISIIDQKHYLGYVSQGNIDAVSDAIQSLNYFLVLSDKLLYWFVVSSLFYIIIFKKYFTLNLSDKRLFSFILILLSFANFLKEIPQGERFMSVFYLFFFSLLIFIYSNSSSKINSIIPLFGIVPMLLYSGFILRGGAETLNLILFLPFLFLSLLVGLEYPVFNITFRLLHLR